MERHSFERPQDFGCWSKKSKISLVASTLIVDRPLGPVGSACCPGQVWPPCTMTYDTTTVLWSAFAKVNRMTFVPSSGTKCGSGQMAGLGSHPSAFTHYETETGCAGLNCLGTLMPTAPATGPIAAIRPDIRAASV